jgi:hypothetical protein
MGAVMVTTAVVVAVLAAASPVTFDEPEPVHHSSVYFVTGLGAPLGFAGIESVTRVAPWLEISGGLGLGLNASESDPQPSLGHMLQWSVMPRLFLSNNQVVGLTLGAGVSGGNYANPSFLCIDCQVAPTSYRVSYFVWGNVEFGAEVWTPFGLAGRGFVGYAHGWCTSSWCVSAANDIPYLGIGVGYAF